MLLMPFTASMIAAGIWHAIMLPLLLMALLALYMARFSLTQWLRFRLGRSQQGTLIWLFLYSGLGLLSGSILVLGYGLWALVPMAGLALLSLALYLFLVWKRRDRSSLAELLGVSTLTMSAWASFYTATGSLESTGLVLWLVCFLFFGSSVFYVKMKVETRSRSKNHLTLKQKLVSGKGVVSYQALSLAAILSLIWSGLVPIATVVAFLPITLQRAIGIANLKKKPAIKRLGFTELGHSILFGLLLGLVFR